MASFARNSLRQATAKCDGAKVSIDVTIHVFGESTRFSGVFSYFRSHGAHSEPASIKDAIIAIQSP